MLRFLTIVCLGFLCDSQITNLGVPRQRYLKNTPWGQLHYVTSPVFDASRTTLLLFHGNPDSLDSYAKFLQDPVIKQHYNFLAFDYFGCGSSDDCTPPACSNATTLNNHSFVTIPEFIGIVRDIVHERQVPVDSGLACVGVLKGAQAAIECAKQFGSRVSGLFAVAAVWFTPEAVEAVKEYTLHTRSVRLFPNGSQYLDAWHQPSVAPCDAVNATYCKVWTKENLWLNHVKTLNRIRSFETQWQLILAGLERNDDLVNRTMISEISAPVKYIAWPERAISMWAMDGFEPDKLIASMNTAWINATDGEVIIDYVANASEGTMVQNASYYAKKIHELLARDDISLV